jgi:hypothetical protein
LGLNGSKDPNPLSVAPARSWSSGVGFNYYELAGWYGFTGIAADWIHGKAFSTSGTTDQDITKFSDGHSTITIDHDVILDVESNIENVMDPQHG